MTNYLAVMLITVTVTNPWVRESVTRPYPDRGLMDDRGSVFHESASISTNTDMFLTWTNSDGLIQHFRCNLETKNSTNRLHRDVIIPTGSAVIVNSAAGTPLDHSISISTNEVIQIKGQEIPPVPK